MTRQEIEPPQRLFDPSKIPLEDTARELIAAFIALVERSEQRARARRPDDLECFRRAAGALVLDLAHWHLEQPDGWLFVSMSNWAYAPEERPAAFLRESFPALLRNLAQVGVLELRKGSQGEFGTGKLSTIRAGAELKNLFDQLKVTREAIGRDPELQGDPIILRGEKVRGQSRDLPLPATPKVDLLRQEMHRVNRWLLEADIDWLSPVDSGPTPDLSKRFMRRVFTRSLEECGRLYGGFWQDVSKLRRLSSLYIEGGYVVELDFGQIGIHVAYAHVGATPPSGDLYEVPGLYEYRGSVKSLLNALLAVKQLPTRFPKGMGGALPRNIRFAMAVELIAKHHSPIAHLFGTSFYLVQQYMESHILLRCIHRMIEEEIFGLPNHDCLLVSVEDAERVKIIMETTAFEVLGLAVPVHASVEKDIALPPGLISLATVGQVVGVEALDQPLSYTPIAALSVPHKRGA